MQEHGNAPHHFEQFVNTAQKCCRPIMVDLSPANYHYEYDLFATTSYANLTQWQLEHIQDFPDQGKQCMVDFWSSPTPRGIFLYYAGVSSSSSSFINNGRTSRATNTDKIHEKNSEHNSDNIKERQVDEEVNRDKTGEADEMNLEVDSKDEVMHI